MAIRIAGGDGGWEWVQASVPCLPCPAPPPPRPTTTHPDVGQGGWGGEGAANRLKTSPAALVCRTVPSHGHSPGSSRKVRPLSSIRPLDDPIKRQATPPKRCAALTRVGQHPILDLASGDNDRRLRRMAEDRPTSFLFAPDLCVSHVRAFVAGNVPPPPLYKLRPDGTMCVAAPPRDT